MQYTILWNASPNNLITAVNVYLADGWEPLGGVSGAYQPLGAASFAQAMIKKDNK